MDKTKSTCDGCQRKIDFSEEASGGCFTHKKDYCWKCTEEHICVLGERCSRFFITNPKWIVNLRNSNGQN